MKITVGDLRQIINEVKLGIASSWPGSPVTYTEDFPDPKLRDIQGRVSDELYEALRLLVRITSDEFHREYDERGSYPLKDQLLRVEKKLKAALRMVDEEYKKLP